MENEKRLIDAMATVTKISKRVTPLIEQGCHQQRVYSEVLKCIAEAPTVNVVEVVHGRWENITGGMITLGDCSKCKVRQPVIGTNYCKYCGAKMYESRKKKGED